MFMAYVILKLSRSKMKLSRLKNFTDKNDPLPPFLYHNRIKQWNASQQVLVTFYTTQNRIFSKIRGRT